LNHPSTREYAFLIQPTPSQIRQIIALYRLAGWWGDCEPDDPEQVARIVSGSHCFLVVMREGEIVGMGRAISDRASDAYIQDVTVKPECRGQRIGTWIVEKLIERLHRDGLGWIGLIAERGSHEFYRRMGFREMPNSLPMLKL